MLHKQLVILVLALTLDGQVHTGDIIGGQEVVNHSRPYMVHLERHGETGESEHCDGFLLNEDFVMTAAHCQANSYTVLLGAHNLHEKKEIQRVSVEQAFPHEDYGSNYENDIMLLKLSSKAIFGNHVQPIELADKGNGSLPQSCSIAGWGITEENAEHISPVLMEVNVTLIDNNMCREKHSYCSEGKTGPRQGDSGGPLVCEDKKAYGVVSAGYKPDKSRPEFYAFYAKIPDYRSWINSTMKHHGID